MKILNLETRQKSFFLLSFVVMVMLASACSPKINFPTSVVDPSATPKASVRKIENGDYRVKMDVNNLVVPERLSPQKKNYVVWVNTETHGVRNIGELKNRRGMLANKGKAHFEGTIPYKPVQIIVTAEHNPHVQISGDHTVFRSEIFRLKK